LENKKEPLALFYTRRFLKRGISTPQGSTDGFAFPVDLYKLYHKILVK